MTEKRDIFVLEFIKKSLREHLVLTVAIAILAPFTTFSLVSMFFGAGREIVYELNEVFSRCGLSRVPGKDCAALYEFIIGNTGSREETVRLAWPFDLSPWERGQQVMNISADEPRDHDPRIACESDTTRSECVVEKFAPGALVIMKFTCTACSGHDIGMMQDRMVTVISDAELAHGDPRVTTVVRRLQNVLEIFL